MREEQRLRDDRLREEQRARDDRFQEAILAILSTRQGTAPAQPATAVQPTLPAQQVTSAAPILTSPEGPGSPPPMEALRPTTPRREKVSSTTTGEKVRSSGGLQPGPSHVVDVVPTSPPPSRKRIRHPSPNRVNARTKRIKGEPYIPLDEMDVVLPPLVPMDTLPDRQGLRNAFVKSLVSIPGWFPLTLSVGAYVIIRFMYVHERARWITYTHHCDKGHKTPAYRKPFHYYGAEMAAVFDSICQNKYNKLMDQPDIVLKDFLPWFKRWNPKWTRPYICSSTHHVKKAKNMRVLTEVDFLNRFLEDIGCPTLIDAEDILRSTDNAILPQNSITREFLDNYVVKEPSTIQLWPNHIPRGLSKEIVSSSSDTDGPSAPAQQKATRRKKIRARKSPSTDATAPTASAASATTDAQHVVSEFATSVAISANISDNPVNAASVPATTVITSPPPGPILPTPVVVSDNPATPAKESAQESPVQYTSGSLSPASKQANAQDAARNDSDEQSEGNIFSDTILNFCEELLQ